MEITVKFETITPLYTGDAWQNCKEIKPSSIMGSLRFWFEVLCYFNGIIDDNYFDNGAPKESLDYDDEFNNEEYETDEILSKLENSISIPSRIFGCTGWKSRIRIKEINPTVEDIGNVLNLPYSIGVKKDNENDNTIEWKTKKKYSRFIEKKYNKNNYNFKKDWSVWYFAHPYFYGKFEVIFETDEITKDAVLIPLLNFIEKYGYIGGKWNIGYGRVKILNEDWDKDKTKFELSKFKLGKFKHEDFDFENKVIEEVNDFKELLNKKKKILVLKNKINGDFKKIIEELIKIKAEKRKKHRNNRGNGEERHQLFGYHKPTQGTKIIPYIYEKNEDEDKKLKGGFISIAGVLNIKGGKNE